MTRRYTPPKVEGMASDPGFMNGWPHASQEQRKRLGFPGRKRDRKRDLEQMAAFGILPTEQPEKDA